jgi:hypothetical protein
MSLGLFQDVILRGGKKLPLYRFGLPLDFQVRSLDRWCSELTGLNCGVICLLWQSRG